MSLAVAEKRPQQPRAGCVGVFFQLFSRKKLFSNSKKLLRAPPAKNPAAKFGAHDKSPRAKLLLIADENSGGFPKLESMPSTDPDSRMQTPGLVARLMGLESMPVLHNEKPRKALDSQLCTSGNSFRQPRVDKVLHVDSGGNARVELRPRNLQKTGGRFSERRPVRAFHKGLIYGSKKKEHMKLETPVKSPRLILRSSNSRLVQVASKILEPGLQSRSQAKCAITYAGSFENGRAEDREGPADSVASSCNSSVSSVGAKGSLAADCGSLSSELSSELEEKMKPPVIRNGQRKIDSAGIQPKLKAEEVYRRKVSVVPGRQSKNGYAPKLAKHNVVGRGRDATDKKENLQVSGYQHEKSVSRKSSLMQNQLLPIRDKAVPGAKIRNTKRSEKNLNELNCATKNFVVLNKNLNNCPRSRSPTKVSGTCRIELEKDDREWNLIYRGIPGNKCAEDNFVKEKNAGNAMSRKGTRFTNNQSVDGSWRKDDLLKMSDGTTQSSNNSIVSFTFSSPIRRGLKSTNRELISEGRRVLDKLEFDAFHLEGMMSDVDNGSLSSQKDVTLRGDELSRLLEEKIRELSSLNQVEKTSENDVQERSTVTILEELISALTTGTPADMIYDSCSCLPVPTDRNASHDQMTNVEPQEKSQPDATATNSNGFIEQPSPVSIIEASFSNDSCSTRSFNETSGTKPQLDSVETCNNAEAPVMDSDILDSAISMNISQSPSRTISICDSGFSESEVGTATVTITDTELLFENISFHGSDRELSYSFDSFLLDTLENITHLFSLTCRPLTREFLFDCVMECLELKFSHFCRCGFRTWLKLPSILNRARLMREFQVEIRGWWDLAGKSMPDLVCQDTNMLNLKWIEFDHETFEMGAEIQSEILQRLIDDMVIDLC